jgi:hypothetical protein
MESNEVRKRRSGRRRRKRRADVFGIGNVRGERPAENG